MPLIGPWSKKRCNVAQFIPWLRPDPTFPDENDPRSGMMSFVSRWPIRAGTKLCEHLMGGVLALDSDGMARLHTCSKVDNFRSSQSQGRLFLGENGMLMGVSPYSGPRVQWAAWYGNKREVQQ